ncbi:hypothetical protein QRO11_04290 [Paracidovorax citrulli]|nr:hypothetical protein [Paracidovorax citrulli]QCX09951.1 hypothetical protein APS58_1037 [Paracidovorax citrulli]UEG47057.1 hypothetical protein LKW27_04030 [Paracidovorax citrulli]UMT82019.1 hypothetical protein FRC75_00545 [Paracidovorax citrulli]UMT89660.1 hypothetical protein FRC90_17365 [Paracidovorax citrulli]UMT93740.1 hypothetical protein FRC97_01195 [Paracidovorax citrulli]
MRPHRFTPFLLLALWLNACLGWSWHEATHLRQALQPAVPAAVAAAGVTAAAGDKGSPSASAASEAPSEDTAPQHGTCAACLAFAHLQAAAPQPAPQPCPEGPGATPGPPDHAARARGRCTAQPFLARGPPAGTANAPAPSAEAA